MMHPWSGRIARAIKRKLPSEIPLITGQRIIDFFFPVAKGGTAAVHGPFGSGKTVLQQALAKFADAQVIVYVACGERGNEMTEDLETFPTLLDHRTQHTAMNRTTVLVNTSNMHIAA